MTKKQMHNDILKELYDQYHITGYVQDHSDLVKRMKAIPKKMVITAAYDASKKR